MQLITEHKFQRIASASFVYPPPKPNVVSTAPRSFVFNRDTRDPPTQPSAEFVLLRPYHPQYRMSSRHAGYPHWPLVASFVVAPTLLLYTVARSTSGRFSAKVFKDWKSEGARYYKIGFCSVMATASCLICIGKIIFIYPDAWQLFGIRSVTKEPEGAKEKIPLQIKNLNLRNLGCDPSCYSAEPWIQFRAGSQITEKPSLHRLGFLLFLLVQNQIGIALIFR